MCCWPWSVGIRPSNSRSDRDDQIRKPKLVVPMHFRTLTYKPRNSFWVEKFLANFDDAVVDFAFASEVTISPATLPGTHAGAGGGLRAGVKCQRFCIWLLSNNC